MAKFLSKDICIKLRKLGCKSESEFYFFQEGRPCHSELDVSNNDDIWQAFNPWDMIGTHDQANKNIQLFVVALKNGKYKRDYDWNLFRHRILDSACAIAAIENFAEEI